MPFDRDACAAFYAENGYFVHENALTMEEVELLRQDATRIAATSASTSPTSSRRDVEVPGHPAIVDVLTAVIGPNVKCMQSMLFIKAAGKPGQAWHQDEYFIPTRDRSLTGGWIALDDATSKMAACG
jgi:phytanoyl-CoA hydroxylase